MNKKEIIEYLKQNMPEFTGDNIERQKRMAMYIYLELGKLKAFDEKYFFANNKTKTKIYSLAQASKNNVEEIAKRKKIICVTLSYLYYRKVLVLKGKIDNKKRHQQRCLKNIIFLKLKL